MLRDRLVIDLRHDQSLEGSSAYDAKANRLPASGEAHLNYANDQQNFPAGTGKIAGFSALRSLNFQFPANVARGIENLGTPHYAGGKIGGLGGPLNHPGRRGAVGDGS